MGNSFESMYKNSEAIRIDIQNDFRTFPSTLPHLKLPKTGAEYRKILFNVLMFPARVALVPITVPLGLIATRLLSSTSQHTPNWDKTKNGKWEYLNIHRPNKTKPIEVNSFKLSPGKNQAPKKLHINVHGLGGEASQFDFVAPFTAETFQADQWNITRRPSWTVAAQINIILDLIEAAIEQGYKEIRLTGFSVGANLVAKTYDDLMTKPKYQHFREKLKKEGITLHYTAINGYKSEGLTIAGMLTRYGKKFDRDYVNGEHEAPKPSLFMRTFSWVVHNLPLFNLTSLRIRSDHGLAFPPESKNFVVNCLTSTSKTSADNKTSVDAQISADEKSSADGRKSVWLDVGRDPVTQFNTVPESGHALITIPVDINEVKKYHINLIVEMIAKLMPKLKKVILFKEMEYPPEYEFKPGEMENLLNNIDINNYSKDPSLEPKFVTINQLLKEHDREYPNEEKIKELLQEVMSFIEMLDKCKLFDELDKSGHLDKLIERGALEELGKLVSRGLLDEDGFDAFIQKGRTRHMVGLIPSVFARVNQAIIKSTQDESKIDNENLFHSLDKHHLDRTREYDKRWSKTLLKIAEVENRQVFPSAKNPDAFFQKEHDKDNNSSAKAEKNNDLNENSTSNPNVTPVVKI